MPDATEKPTTIAKKLRGKPFQPGNRASAGRPKGSRNKRTLEGIEFFADVLRDPAWQESARERMMAGTAPHLEKYGVEICFGKPRDRVSLETSDGQPFGVLAVPMPVPLSDWSTATTVTDPALTHEPGNGNGNGNGAEH